MEANADEVKSKGTVFIIDDDTFLLDMYAMRFTQAGYTVETAMNAAQTIEMLEQINSEHLVPDTVKIYLSNLGQEQDIARGKSLGAASYIVKANSTPSEVVKHVEEVVQKSKAV